MSFAADPFLGIQAAETAEMMAAWHQAGFLSVDMETATTFSVAQHCQMSVLSIKCEPIRSSDYIGRVGREII